MHIYPAFSRPMLTRMSVRSWIVLAHVQVASCFRIHRQIIEKETMNLSTDIFVIRASWGPSEERVNLFR